MGEILEDYSRTSQEIFEKDGHATKLDLKYFPKFSKRFQKYYKRLWCIGIDQMSVGEYLSHPKHLAGLIGKKTFSQNVIPLINEDCETHIFLSMGLAIVKGSQVFHGSKLKDGHS